MNFIQNYINTRKPQRGTEGRKRRVNDSEFLHTEYHIEENKAQTSSTVTEVKKNA